MSSSPVIHDPIRPVLYINGLTIPKGRLKATGQHLVDAFQTALSTDYDGKDPRKFGLTKAQAIAVSIAELAADGNLSAVNLLLDRLLGKPVQQINSTTVTADLKDFLDHLDKMEVSRETVDVTPAPAPATEDIKTSEVPWS